MGAWGTGLYSDDFALDVKSEFLDAINSGKPYREAFEELKKTYVDNTYNDDPDIPVFWFVCADILWKKGRLDEDIKQTALAYIESNSDVERWNLESSALGKKRKTVLEKLKAKLLSPQPEAKPIRIKKFYECPWNIGDVFAIPLQGEEAKKHNLIGTYLIFQVADKMLFSTTTNKAVGDLVPIVRAQLSFAKEIPQLNDYDGNSIVQMRHECPATDFKKVYAIELDIFSNREVPKNLIFIGNKELIVPDDDYGIRYDGFEIYNSFVSTTFRFLEDKCIRCYFGYNLKGFSE